MSLTVCTVNYRTWKYIYFQDLTFRRLAQNKSFKRLIIDVTPDHAEVDKLRRLPHCEVVSVDLPGLTGSASHGAAINAALSHIKTDYAVIADPDTATVAENWDGVCLAALSNDVLAIGAPYHPEFKIRYQNFPNAIFFFFNTVLLQEGMDWRPLPYWLRKTKTKLSPYLPFLSAEDPDVGWKIPRLFQKKGFHAKSFEFLMGRDPGAVVLAPDGNGDEYHWQGRPLVTHQGRSGPRGFNQDPNSVRWLDNVCRYLRINKTDVEAAIAAMDTAS